MNEITYQYSIIRFAPFIETEEFANIGIVLFEPKSGLFKYRLQLKKHARITHFFEPLKADVYRASVNNLRFELDRISRFASFGSKHQKRFELGEAEMTRSFFDELTGSREGTIRFSETRVVLGERSTEKLEELFKHYVDRKFVNHQYGEALLEKGMRALLAERQLGDTFVKAELDDGIYRKTFPFVKKEDEKIVKVIKPFFLGQNRSTQIIDHGVTWIHSVKRFQKSGKLPSDVLFAVKGPEKNGSRRKAFEEVVNEMEDEGIVVVPFSNSNKILRYAFG